MVEGVRVFDTVHAEPQSYSEAPRYRVHFWQRPSPEHAWNLDAHVLADVQDVTDVLAWVDEHARGRSAEVFVETADEPEGAFDTPRTTGLVRLLGSDPNASEPVEIGRFTPTARWSTDQDGTPDTSAAG